MSLGQLKVGNSKLISMAGMPKMDRAFFPGGNGLLQGSDSLADTPIEAVILGSNFGSVGGFLDEFGQLRRRNETRNPTWRGILYRLGTAGVDSQRCFFTNAWPLLHKGSSNLTGEQQEDWLYDAELMKSCNDFFLRTLDLTQPNLIIGMGLGAAAFLASVWPDVLAAWRCRSIRSIDNLPLAIVEHSGRKFTCIAITHPSMPSSRHRRPPYSGPDGEAQLIMEAIQMQPTALENRVL